MNEIKIEAGYTDYSEAADYESLKKSIKAVLRRYFECDDSGESNKEYDEDFSASEAIDAIHDIVGEI